MPIIQGVIHAKIRIETSIRLDDDNKKIFAEKISSFASEILGKPEAVMMVTIFDGLIICFGATHELSASSGA